MNIDIAVWVGSLLFVIGVWLLMAKEWGFVERADHEGFVFRSVLRTTRFVRWDSVAGSVQCFTSLLPRIIVRLRDRRFAKLQTSFAILLRHRQPDRDFLSRVQERFKVIPVEKISQLNEW